MDRQITFADIQNASRKRVTKREEFLRQMDKAIPWEALVALVKPYYFEGKRGRKPMGIEKMLRMYFLQLWFNLSDEGVEDAIYDSRAFSEFMGISFGLGDQAPDATTLLKFRRIIESKGLAAQMLDCVNAVLESKGVMMRGGSIVDATFIEAPSSTKNASKSRDPEAHQGKKGNNWHFGYKAHIGVDAGSGLVHTVKTTAANISDVTLAYDLVRKDDSFCYADSGYTGVSKRPEVASDEHLCEVTWVVAEKPSRIKGMQGLAIEHDIESRKASVRSKVEHPFLIVKRQFGYAKCRYKGIVKNANALTVLFTLANVAMWARAGCPEAPAASPA
ncbi:IS5 family transposase [Adlercreutzia sp. ZJ138]|uniref:IS5 family transposase n=1 Tax=Adlercreutzia sp. ZJ138 TaxID=2709405 RepID=UPI0013EB6FF1|nr:IS5 family transposase [Adlercreutzia sp. ZJ138]